MTRAAKQVTAVDRVVSTVDPESRHTHKTSHSYRDGFKAHVANEHDTGLVTDCDLTPGNTPDAEVAPDLLDHEPEGTEVLGDSAYGTGEFRDHLAATSKTAVIKPPPLRPAVPGGFTLDDFESTRTPARSPARRGSPWCSAATAGPAWCQLHHLPAATALHDGQGRASHRPTSPSPPPRRCPGAGRHRRLRCRLPPVAAHGSSAAWPG